ncbi:hypothetical protein NXC14_CH02954 [Rhizobium sp. NXC14]|uniref:DUF2269 family protein n=1 Tax=Rhizobium sp. NXC14 TaxID=1981173 RepID=UPI000A208D5D|nr:DUF2269 domain-containing protein [Rhizobium sp. NXC14]ARO30873.1 hypothetical protein NXC14_CH02954 [Rhizobium sp. NXC14]
MLQEWLLLAHVIGATVLFGTGAGIAFFMVMAHRTRDPILIAHVAATVVIADTVFTATAAILQPVTGYLLARSIGWNLSEGWIALSLLLYVVTGLFWLPVVWIQLQLRDLARAAARSGGALPPSYNSLYRIWFAFGFPAFSAVLGIFWLMLTKPSIALF